MSEFTEDVKKSLPDVEDQNDKETLLQMKRTTEHEIEAFEKGLVEKDKDKENYKVQADLKAKVRKLQAENFAKVPENVQWKFEQMPEYWELQKELLAYQHRQENHMDEQTMKRFDMEKADLKRRIEENKEKLKRIDAQLGDDNE